MRPTEVARDAHWCATAREAWREKRRAEVERRLRLAEIYTTLVAARNRRGTLVFLELANMSRRSLQLWCRLLRHPSPAVVAILEGRAPPLSKRGRAIVRRRRRLLTRWDALRARAARGRLGPVTRALARRISVSRTTLYEWRKRFERNGEAGLGDGRRVAFVHRRPRGTAG